MKFTTKVAYLVFPPYVWSTLIWESKLTWCRWSNFLPRRRHLIKRLKHMRKLKIHLGCGTRSISGWINIDVIAQNGADLLWDLRYSLSFLSDCSARMIYSEHLL